MGMVVVVRVLVVLVALVPPPARARSTSSPCTPTLPLSFPSHTGLTDEAALQELLLHTAHAFDPSESPEHRICWLQRLGAFVIPFSAHTHLTNTHTLTLTHTTSLSLSHTHTQHISFSLL